MTHTNEESAVLETQINALNLSTIPVPETVTLILTLTKPPAEPQVETDVQSLIIPKEAVSTLIQLKVNIPNVATIAAAEGILHLSLETIAGPRKGPQAGTLKEVPVTRKKATVNQKMATLMHQ